MQQFIPRHEHPRPQFVRDTWRSLNGPWGFEMDTGDSGHARGLYGPSPLSSSIIVPFCPESMLSGVGVTDFMAAVWYQRTFSLQENELHGRVLVHFGAVDYFCEVFVGGKSVGTHEGGYVSFTMDITGFVQTGENLLTVYARDNNRSGLQPRGKQSAEYFSHHCDYTRTTGIWQSVWLEFVPDTYIGACKYYPDPENVCLHGEIEIHNPQKGMKLCVRASFDGRVLCATEVSCKTSPARFTLPLVEKHLWEVGKGDVYDLQLEILHNSQSVDLLSSYFGLRSVAFDGMKFLVNGKPVFMRLILDQGFYPDGIYTAPSDEELKNDILRSLAMGFNGARLHEKVFEARFLYHADHMGYLCFGEMANWGLDHSKPEALAIFQKEWLQAVNRDFSSPAIIGWCPFNETWDIGGRKQDDEVLRCIYRLTKALDSTRPCIDTSGNYHVETDIYDVHDYDQSPEVFLARYGKGVPLIHDNHGKRQTYGGQPVFVSEYGGIGWQPGHTGGWGYGQNPTSEEEFIARYKGLTDVLLDNPEHCGFCYTQLTDVEQEINGLYTYARVPKFDPTVIHAITSRRAACEIQE